MTHRRRKKSSRRRRENKKSNFKETTVVKKRKSRRELADISKGVSEKEKLRPKIMKISKNELGGSKEMDGEREAGKPINGGPPSRV